MTNGKPLWQRCITGISGEWFLVLAGAIPLLFALFSQYVLGLWPCELCIYQRYPYAALPGLAVLAYAARRQKYVVLYITFMLLSVLILLIGAGIAAYHAGVEYGWFSGPGGCTGDVAPGLSIEDLRRQILNAPLVRCDQPAVVIFGLSMAGWNVIVSLGLAAWAGLLTRHYCKKGIA